MAAPSENVVYLWVNSEPFDTGIVPVPPPSKLTHHNLRKLFAYAKNKGKAGFPNISYAVWKHVACNKLLMEESLAWLYFQTCKVLTEASKWCLSHQESYKGFRDDSAKLKDHMTVDLLRFILFLYVQHAQVISLKSPAVTGDEWPSRSGRASELEGRCPSGSKGVDEQAQMAYIVSNITDILDLLVEPDSYGDEADVYLTSDAVKALSFLLGATMDGRTIMGVHEVACNPSEASRAGYSKTSKMFSCRRLQSWIKAFLRPHPFGVIACLSLGEKLRGRGYTSGDESLNASLSTSLLEDSMNPVRDQADWANVQDQLLKVFSQPSAQSGKSSQGSLVNKIFTNGNYAPETAKLLIFNQVCKRTIARSGDALFLSTVKIHRCQHSNLYLLSPLHSVVIDQCHDSTIVLGAVETAVSIIECQNVQILAVAGRAIIKSSRDCTFHLCTPNEPILIGKNRGLKFAPYYTFYPCLQADMSKVGLLAEPNLWNRPQALSGKSEQKPEQSTAGSCWSELPPEDFFRFTVPFEMEGNTRACPCKLPLQYESALRTREKRIEDWHELIRDSNLDKQQRQQLQSLVNDRFQSWLKENGHTLQLEGLTLSSMPPTAPR